MKPVLLLSTFLFSLAAFSQKDLSLDKLLQGRMGCGTVAETPAPRLPATVNNHCSLPMDTAQRPAIRIRCHATIMPGNEPLIVLDGVPLENGKLSSVNPNNIESITILKDLSAQALYGCRASNGVIIITTKKLKGCGLLILDAENKVPIGRATVVFSDGKVRITTASSKEGKVWLPEQKKEESPWVQVTSVGYTAFVDWIRFDSANQVRPVFLKKARNYLDTVVIVSHRSNRIRCCFGCGAWLKSVREQHACNKPQTLQSFSVWPNPVNAGQTLEVLPPKDFIGVYQVLSSGGQLLQTGKATAPKGENFRILTGRWPAGLYFIRLDDEATGKAITQKVIIQ